VKSSVEILLQHTVDPMKYSADVEVTGGDAGLNLSSMAVCCPSLLFIFRSNGPRIIFKNFKNTKTHELRHWQYDEPLINHLKMLKHDIKLIILIWLRSTDILMVQCVAYLSCWNVPGMWVEKCSKSKKTRPELNTTDVWGRNEVAAGEQDGMFRNVDIYRRYVIVLQMRRA
jgi:hypothetical protein